MTQIFAADPPAIVARDERAYLGCALAGALLLAPLAFSSAASAQALGYALDAARRVSVGRP